MNKQMNTIHNGLHMYLQMLNFNYIGRNVNKQMNMIHNGLPSNVEFQLYWEKCEQTNEHDSQWTNFKC